MASCFRFICSGFSHKTVTQKLKEELDRTALEILLSEISRQIHNEYSNVSSCFIGAKCMTTELSLDGKERNMARL